MDTTSIHHDDWPMNEHAYSTSFPVFIFDIDLTPVEFAVFSHFKRIWDETHTPIRETNQQTAQKCRISIPTMIKARRSLVERGLLTYTPGTKTTPSVTDICEVTR